MIGAVFILYHIVLISLYLFLAILKTVQAVHIIVVQGHVALIGHVGYL